MAIEPVKIPADIQVEEKIIGPIGLRQIFILIITGAMGYILFNIAKESGPVSLFGTILCWSPLMIGAAFAFLKVNDVGLFTLLLLFIEQMEKPTVRSYGPRRGLTINIRTSTTKEEKPKTERKDLAPEDKLKELSDFLDTGMQQAESEAKLAKAAVTEEAAITETAATPTPVQPDRISASSDPSAPVVDDIALEQSEPPEPEPGTNNLLRDIVPRPE